MLGYVDGGLDAWREAGKETATLETVRARDIGAGSRGSDGSLIVDVRERWEWESGHVEGSMSIPLAEVPARISEIPAGRELIVVCAAGRRAAVAASLLQRAGRRPRFLAAGGAPNLLDRAG